jgi:hypothetical protein
MSCKANTRLYIVIIKIGARDAHFSYINFGLEALDFFKNVKVTFLVYLISVSTPSFFPKFQ